MFQVVPLDWWPLTRDCLAYGFTVSVLICIIHDERVEWYEALILVLLYIVYIGVMYFDKTIQKWARGKPISPFPDSLISDLHDRNMSMVHSKQYYCSEYIIIYL